MRFCLIVFFLLSGIAASAEPIAGIGMNLLYERGADGRTIDVRSPFSLQAGYRFPELLDIFLEYSMFRTSDGESTISVTRDRHEFLLWARHLFGEDWQVNPYVGAGLGFYIDQVETSFEREVSRETGDPDSVLALNAGLRLPISRHFEVVAEGRAAFAARYSPNPTWGLGVAAGFRF